MGRWRGLYSLVTVLLLFCVVYLCADCAEDVSAEDGGCAGLMKEPVSKLMQWANEGHKDDCAKNKDLHLAVVACGDRLEETLVMFKSALLFSINHIHIHIFADDDLRPLFKQQLSTWPAFLQRKFTLHLYPITYPEGRENWRNVFKPCATQRLFIPSVISADITDSLIYVDTDILFMRPVDDLWAFFGQFNSSHIAALAPEHENPRAGWYNRFARHPYYGAMGVNSGVMLMNLTRMRDADWLEHIIPYYEEYKLRITWGDQDLINIFFHYYPDKLYIFDCDWNYRPDHCMYGSVCKQADEHGISVVHGNRGVYHDEKQPAFRAVYESIRDHHFGDSLQLGLVEKLKTVISKPEVTGTYCGRVHTHFTKVLEREAVAMEERLQLIRQQTEMDQSEAERVKRNVETVFVDTDDQIVTTVTDKTEKDSTEKGKEDTELDFAKEEDTDLTKEKRTVEVDGEEIELTDWHFDRIQSAIKEEFPYAKNNEEYERVLDEYMVKFEQSKKEISEGKKTVPKPKNYMKEKNTSKRMNLAVAACGDRLEETMVMLKSAALLSRRKLHFYIFADDELRPQFRKQLNAWPDTVTSRVTFSLRPITFPRDNSVQWKKLFKPCASQRLFLPDLLKDVDSLLYVDTDILFLRPLDDLFKKLGQFNSTQIAGVAPEHKDAHTSWYKRFARHPYVPPLGVNSGVMLMNLTRMRDADWLTHIVPYYETYRYNITWGDQDLINIFFHHFPEMLYQFDCDWNFRPDHCMYMSVCKQAEENGISIVHGNRGVYHDDKQPAFKAVYETIKEYPLDVSVNQNLATLLSEKIQTLGGNTNCGKLEKIFTKMLSKQIEKHIKWTKKKQEKNAQS